MHDLDWSSIPPRAPTPVAGCQVTLEITARGAWLAGIGLGTLLALLRLSRPRSLAWIGGRLRQPLPLRPAGDGAALVLPDRAGAPGRVLLVPRSSDMRFASAIVAFALFEAAYYAEIIRAGIQSVSRGQLSAALALGMRPAQAMRLVILPQAFRNMVPLLLTQGIILFQDTSLVYVIGLADFFGAADKVGDRDGRLVELLLFAGAVYFVVSFAASTLVQALPGIGWPHDLHSRGRQALRRVPGPERLLAWRWPGARWWWSAAPPAPGSPRSSSASTAWSRSRRGRSW